jgi:hypothetical protein
MADDKNAQGVADRTRINVHQEYEVRYWTEALGVSKDQLVELVQRVGPLADDVRAALGKRS